MKVENDERGGDFFPKVEEMEEGTSEMKTIMDSIGDSGSVSFVTDYGPIPYDLGDLWESWRRTHEVGERVTVPFLDFHGCSWICRWIE